MTLISYRFKLNRLIFGFVCLYWSNLLFAEELTKCENKIENILPVSEKTLANINYLKSTSQFPTKINPEIIKIKSKTVISDEFISFFYPAKKPKGLLIFIHGGGCNRILNLLEMTNINELEINKYMYLEGYSILILGHAIGTNDLMGNEKLRQIYSEKSTASRCLEVTKIHLQRVKDAISQAKETIGKDLPTYVLGHSYGGYLVSLLSSMPNKLLGVNGYISYAGIWDPEYLDEYGKEYHANPEMSAFKNEQINLSNILVIQSKDDQAVRYNQYERFEILEKNNKSKSIVAKCVQENGGHYTDDAKINNKILDSITDFIEKTK